MINVETFKGHIKKLLETNNRGQGNIIELRDKYNGACALMDVIGFEVSWGDVDVKFFVPGVTTFCIPYGSIVLYRLAGQNPVWTSVEIVLNERWSLTIKENKED